MGRFVMGRFVSGRFISGRFVSRLNVFGRFVRQDKTSASRTGEEKAQTAKFTVFAREISSTALKTWKTRKTKT